jgi:uncharacterized protein DUF4920
MKRLVLILSVAAAAAGCMTSQRFGATPGLSGPALSLEQALAPGNVGRTIAIRGAVAEVCQMEGCWMVLTDGTRSVRTTFKDGAFTVPKDIAGKAAVAEGKLSHTSVSEEMRRHYAQDSGKSAAEIASIQGPKDEYSFVADSLIVRR